jgi:hypothetical protein
LQLAGCHRFRANEVRLWLSVLACNLSNLGRRLSPVQDVRNWSLTSLQQRLWIQNRAGILRLQTARSSRQPDSGFKIEIPANTYLIATRPYLATYQRQSAGKFTWK